MKNRYSMKKADIDKWYAHKLNKQVEEFDEYDNYITVIIEIWAKEHQFNLKKEL